MQMARAAKQPDTSRWLLCRGLSRWHTLALASRARDKIWRFCPTHFLSCILLMLMLTHINVDAGVTAPAQQNCHNHCLFLGFFPHKKTQTMWHRLWRLEPLEQCVSIDTLSLALAFLFSARSFFWSEPVSKGTHTLSEAYPSPSLDNQKVRSGVLSEERTSRRHVIWWAHAGLPGKLQEKADERSDWMSWSAARWFQWTVKLLRMTDGAAVEGTQPPAAVASSIKRKKDPLTELQEDVTTDLEPTVHEIVMFWSKRTTAQSDTDLHVQWNWTSLCSPYRRVWRYEGVCRYKLCFFCRSTCWPPSTSGNTCVCCSGCVMLIKGQLPLCHMDADQGRSWMERLENKWLITGSQKGSESAEANGNLQPLKERNKWKRSGKQLTAVGPALHQQKCIVRTWLQIDTEAENNKLLSGVLDLCKCLFDAFKTAALSNSFW